MTRLRMIPSRSIELLRNSGTIHNLYKGQLLFKEGDPSYGLYVLLTGKIEVFRNSINGETVLATMGPEEVFGEIGLILPTRQRTAGARASEDSTVLEISHNFLDINQPTSADPEVVCQLLEGVVRILSTRLYQKDDLDTPQAPRGYALHAVGMELDPQADAPLQALATIESMIPPDIVSQWLNDKRLSDGQILFREGDAADCFYFLKRGTVELIREASPKEPLTSITGPGLLGEAGYFLQLNRSATARAKGIVKVTRFLKGNIRNYGKSHPREAIVILHAVAHWLSCLILDRESPDAN